MASLVHPTFTQYAKLTVSEVMQQMVSFDFALWYLDDGCYMRRPPNSHRFSISIGNVATGGHNLNVFWSKVRELFSRIHTRGFSMGNIHRNNTYATENNMQWEFPIPIGLHLVQLLDGYYIPESKIPKVEGSETILTRSRAIGINGSKLRHLSV